MQICFQSSFLMNRNLNATTTSKTNTDCHTFIYSSVLVKLTVRRSSCAPLLVGPSSTSVTLQKSFSFVFFVDSYTCTLLICKLTIRLMNIRKRRHSQALIHFSLFVVCEHIKKSQNKTTNSQDRKDMEFNLACKYHLMSLIHKASSS